MDSKHIDLINARKLVYDQCGFELTNQKEEIESAEYGACEFKLNEAIVKYRVSKITPTKTGQFVTIWKRNADGQTAPFDSSDNIDFIIISARSNNHFGQFIFPRHVLLDKGIMSQKNKEGKRGIRVYPPWDKATNKQAEKTQKWQLDYFLEIHNNNTTDLLQAKMLLSK